MEQAPERTARHDALDVFCGEWKAEGTSFSGTDQTGGSKRNGEPWSSTHVAAWHAGSFFLRQDERATIAAKPFDTLSIIGVDPASGAYSVRSFENHGFYRHYSLLVDGNVWTLSGATERARIKFANDDRTQLISWEWKPDKEWLPLCDRTATRID